MPDLFSRSPLPGMYLTPGPTQFTDYAAIIVTQLSHNYNTVNNGILQYLTFSFLSLLSYIHTSTHISDQEVPDGNTPPKKSRVITLLGHITHLFQQGFQPPLSYLLIQPLKF